MMRRRTTLAAAALFAATVSPAAAATRMLFVGIDSYANSAGKPGNRDVEFKDLHGSVNDVMLVRKALAGDRWKLPIDDFRQDGRCEARRSDGLSITLVDACASRTAIITALTQQITAAADGDTVFFYFAGHGGQMLDDTRTQNGKFNGTLVPYDARGVVNTEIVDIDLGRLIDAAVARGVNVVTVFDSCNSGTATRDLRDGVDRAVSSQPSPHTDSDDIAPPPPRHHATSAYRVHLAAAVDGESAREIPFDGVVHGVYTLALVDALTGLSQPAYADIADAIRSNFASRAVTQTPRAEGPLQTLFLGLRPPVARIFAATSGADPRRLRLAGGSISGATPGSVYNVFSSSGDAVRQGAAPISTGTIESADFDAAVLLLAAPLVNPPRTLQAREIDHVAGGKPVRLRIDGGTPPQRALVTHALAGVGTIKLVGDAPDYVLAFEAAGLQLRGGNEARGSTGGGIGAPIPLGDPGLVETRVADTARQLSQYFATASLATPVTGPSRGIAFSHDCADPDDNPLVPQPEGEAEMVAGEPWVIRYTNTAPEKRYAYLIALGSKLEIEPAIIEETQLDPGKWLRRRGLVERTPGRGLILLLLTQGPVDLQSLRQEGIKDLAGLPASSALERLLLAARNGQASRSIETVDAWRAEIATYRVVTPDKRKEAAPCQFRARNAPRSGQ
jgi:hypothetical protein